ncbi:MAG: Flp pilus assembly complex ATPase component TadA, partial [Propionibacteriales bacterium]|nr:Flp pilus assembly complex ATPase component TadA [Propionibacteriales bacterium]
VGEVRGAEVVDLLAALNTGHEGGCGTVHANAAADVPARFEALPGAVGLSREAVHAQLSAALQAIVHLRRERDGSRRVAEIAVLERRPDGLVLAQTAVSFSPDLSATTGPGATRLESLLVSRPR